MKSELRNGQTTTKVFLCMGPGRANVSNALLEPLLNCLSLSAVPCWPCDCCSQNSRFWHTQQRHCTSAHQMNGDSPTRHRLHWSCSMSDVSSICLKARLSWFLDSTVWAEETAHRAVWCLAPGIFLPPSSEPLPLGPSTDLSSHRAGWAVVVVIPGP